MLVAEIELNPLIVPLPITILFKDVTPDKVVIFGWLTVASVPVMLVAEIELNPLSVPLPTVILFKDVTPPRVVIFG